MKEFTHTVVDPLGLHARPAGKLAQTAAKLKSSVTLYVRDKQANAKSIIALMRLCIKQNDVLTLHLEGEDEEVGAAALQEFCKATL